MEKYKVGIVASDSFGLISNSHHSLMFTEELNRFICSLQGVELKIIVGGGPGVSRLVETFSSINNSVESLYIPANWMRYPKTAVYQRNIDIVDKSDCLLVFWDGSSGEVRHLLSVAHKVRKKTIIVYFDEV